MHRHTAVDPVSGLVGTRSSKEHVYRFAIFVTYNEHAAHGRRREVHGWSATRENAEKTARSLDRLSRPGPRFRGDRQVFPGIVEPGSVTIVPATVTSSGSARTRAAPVHHHLHG